MEPSKTRSGAVLAVVCLCVFAVNVDTTIVNVTLPTLVRDLHATTRELQWIVDAYTLVFAALVLAGGSLGDRYGRRRMLLAGLVVYGLANGAAALTTTPTQLIAARAVMGIGAAMIFPTTLSILTNVFRERGARAKAIGAWGASTGIAVALGPIAGGALLEGFSWPSTFVVKVPLAIVAFVLVARLVPESRDPATPPLDRAGVGLSALAVGLVVYGIIEAPARGWASVATIGVLAAGLALLVIFIAVERRLAHPMLDIGLFRIPRFSASSGAIAVAYFALFGFIFLITQYFQFLRGYSPLSTGLHLIPVAASVAVSSIAGPPLALRVGNKVVVAAGLISLAAAFIWVSGASAGTPYLAIAGQMVFLGAGMGLTSAPATEALMGAVSEDKAGVGSAVNDATRELGGTLGVAVIGSVYASLYVDRLTSARLTGLPVQATDAARDSIGGALIAAGRVAGAGAPDAAERLRAAASAGFFDGLHAGCLVAAGVCLAGAAAAAILLPARPAPEAAPDLAPEPAT